MKKNIVLLFLDYFLISTSEMFIIVEKWQGFEIIERAGGWNPAPTGYV